jgi:hypothetical protein
MASLCLVGTLVFTSLPLYAQGPPAGGPGAAANLNARVEALEQLVATLQTSLSALTQQTSKLESGRITEADMVGTYSVGSLGIEMSGFQAASGGSPAINPRISTETDEGTLTLNANRTVSGSAATLRCTGVTGFGGLVTCQPPDGGSADPYPGVTWTVANGKLVISEEGDEGAELLIGAGGRVLVASGSSTGSPNRSWANIFMLVRLPNP